MFDDRTSPTAFITSQHRLLMDGKLLHRYLCIFSRILTLCAHRQRIVASPQGDELLLSHFCGVPAVITLDCKL